MITFLILILKSSYLIIPQASTINFRFTGFNCLVYYYCCFPCELISNKRLVKSVKGANSIEVPECPNELRPQNFGVFTLVRRRLYAAGLQRGWNGSQGRRGPGKIIFNSNLLNFHKIFSIDIKVPCLLFCLLYWFPVDINPYLTTGSPRLTEAWPQPLKNCHLKPLFQG